MTRLVAFGCSMTYGQGFPDCTNSPSKHAWPSLLSDKLNCQSQNQGVPGSSNKNTLLEILDFKFQPDDIVVILWTFFHRALLLNEFPINILPNTQANRISKECLKEGPDSWDSYYRIHSDKDMMIDTLLHINHTNLYLKDIGITTYNFYFDSLIKYSLINKQKYIKNVDLHYVDLEVYQTDLAEDNLHPGYQSQQNITDFMYNTIKGNK
jgi:hypothetical protein